MSRHKNQRTLVKIIEDTGAVVDEITHGHGSHIKIHVTYRGITRTFIATTSETDPRAVKNFKADARRWVKFIDQERSK